MLVLSAKVIGVEVLFIILGKSLTYICWEFQMGVEYVFSC